MRKLAKVPTGCAEASLKRQHIFTFPWYLSSFWSVHVYIQILCKKMGILSNVELKMCHYFSHLSYSLQCTVQATSTLSRINLKTQLFSPDRPSVHTKTAFSVTENGTF